MANGNAMVAKKIRDGVKSVIDSIDAVLPKEDLAKSPVAVPRAKDDNDFSP
jgi:hypothetical protein